MAYIEYVLAALTFGLTAGLKPGPLGVFVIHQTLSRGYKHGFLASLAPLLTDGPIIALAVFLALSLKEMNVFVSVISIIGGLYLALIAVKILKMPNSLELEQGDDVSSLYTAVKINLLNPSPYLFWMTIGSSYLIMGTKSESFTFVIVTLGSLCLTKYLVALSIKELGAKFSPSFYVKIIKFLALPLLIFSGQLLLTGFSDFLTF